MRNRFEQQLEELYNNIITLGGLCENAISSCIKALVSGERFFIKDTINIEKEIDQMEHEIERLCMKLLLQQQPVARDLRFISAALKMVTDMERIGDQAADIAEIVMETDISDPRNKTDIIKMAEVVTKMVTESVDAFVKRDINLAEVVIKEDDIVDELFKKMKADLIDLIARDKLQGEAALDMLMIAKYLERIGDHAVNTAEAVVYSITGK